MTAMRRVAAVMALLAGLLGLAGPAAAELPDGSADLCWVPDCEFPVPCDEDEE